MIYFENKEIIILSNRVFMIDIFNIRGIFKIELKKYMEILRSYKIRFKFVV